MKILLIFFTLAVSFSPSTVGAMDFSDSIPKQYTLPSDRPGKVVRHSYSCYFYTDLTERGVDIQKRYEDRGYVLERRKKAITKECNVYLPHGYDPKKEYPTVYVLHGLTDDQNTWLDRSNITVLLDNLIASGVIRPCVAVFPNGNSSSKYLDRRFENQAGYYFFENELEGDLIPFIESNYSVGRSRNSRAICGFSMGGMQTINVGLCQGLEHFAWFGAFAAAPTSYNSDQVLKYLEKENEKRIYPVEYFYNLYGASDGVARASHEKVLEGLTKKSKYLSQNNFGYQSVPGGHDYSVAVIGVYNFLRICFSE